MAKRTGQVSRRLAVWVVASAGILGLAGHANASVVDVTQVAALVHNAGAYGGQSNFYSTASLTYAGATPTNTIVLWALSATNNLIGGLANNLWDPDEPGTYAFGFINTDDANYYGLLDGQTPASWIGGIDLNGNGRVGTFDNVTGNLQFDDGEFLVSGQIRVVGFAPYVVSPQPRYTQFAITSISIAHPADANFDGAVDVVDLGILAKNYDTVGGATWDRADFNGDGNVDVVDLGVLAKNYDWVSGGASPTPEPATLSFLALAAMGLLAQRRRSLSSTKGAS